LASKFNAPRLLPRSSIQRTIVTPYGVAAMAELALYYLIAVFLAVLAILYLLRESPMMRSYVLYVLSPLFLLTIGLAVFVFMDRYQIGYYFPHPIS
jgi:hypothetical protein